MGWCREWGGELVQNARSLQESIDSFYGEPVEELKDCD